MVPTQMDRLFDGYGDPPESVNQMGPVAWPATRSDCIVPKPDAQPPGSVKQINPNAPQVAAAAEAVSKEARRRYFGIRSDIATASVEPWPMYMVAEAFAQELNGTVFFLRMQVSAAGASGTKSMMGTHAQYGVAPPGEQDKHGVTQSSFNDLLHDDDTFNDAFALEQLSRAGAGGARGELDKCPPSAFEPTIAQKKMMVQPVAEGSKRILRYNRPISPTRERVELVMLRVWLDRAGKYKLEGMVKGAAAATVSFVEKNAFEGMVLRGRPG